MISPQQGHIDSGTRTVQDDHEIARAEGQGMIDKSADDLLDALDEPLGGAAAEGKG